MTDKTDGAMVSPRNLWETALEAARAGDFAPIEMEDGRHFLPVPKGFDLKDITDPERLPTIPAARVTLDEKDALAAYVNRFKQPGTALFADVDAGEVRAVIDWHLASDGESVESGARVHVAALKLRPSEEFARWDAIEGEMLPQAAFADFLEENASDIVEPEAADIVELARDLSATEGVKFRSKVDLHSGDRVFTYDRETQVAETVRVPRFFTLSIPLYQGEEPMALRAAFRYRIAPGGGGLLLGFEWRRVDYQKLALFKEIAFVVADATGAPVFLGRADK